MLDSPPSSGDTTSKSLTVSHVTLLARPTIRRYPNGRTRAPLSVARGAIFLPFRCLRIDGRASKVTCDTGNDLQIVSPDEEEQEGEEGKKGGRGAPASAQARQGEIFTNPDTKRCFSPAVRVPPYRWPGE